MAEYLLLKETVLGYYVVEERWTLDNNADLAARFEIVREGIPDQWEAHRIWMEARKTEVKPVGPLFEYYKKYVWLQDHWGDPDGIIPKIGDYFWSHWKAAFWENGIMPSGISRCYVERVEMDTGNCHARLLDRGCLLRYSFKDFQDLRAKYGNGYKPILQA